MVSASPSPNNNSADTTSNLSPASSAVVGTTTTTTTTSVIMNNSSINASKNLRGLNKPKCIKCGNVARSRCPYQSCKSCCAKAQNPCHIHVLKGNSGFLDKTPSSSSPLHQHSNEISSSGNSHRVTSLRQLSNNFAQFNNLQTPVRSRKPLTRKEAARINEWRFSKLKEYKDRNGEVENEAFDRYLQNISLLEEVFAINSGLEESKKHETLVSTPDPNQIEEHNKMMVSKLKLKLRAGTETRDKMQFIVHNGLIRLKRFETHSGVEEVELVNRHKKARYAELNDLNKSLCNARTQEDLKSCQLLKAQLFTRPKKPSEESETIVISKQQDAKSDMSPTQKPERFLSKWFSTTAIDQEALSHIDARFSSLEEIEHL